MADEKEVKQEKVETEEKVETKEDTSAEKENATKPAEKAKEEPKAEEVKKEETKTEVADEVNPTEEVAEVQTEPTAPAVRVEDIMARLAARDAKIDAVVKENSDLKNALANKDDELKGMRDRYETPNFGDAQKKGVVTKDKSADDDFESYSRAFMQN